MAKNTKALNDLLTNRIGMANPDTGNSQIGTANPPNAVEPEAPPVNEITVPQSQLGNVQEGDLVTLEVVSNDGTNVILTLKSMKKTKASTATIAQTNVPPEVSTL